MNFFNKRIVCLLIAALLCLSSVMVPCTTVNAAPSNLKLYANNIKVTVAYNANGGTGAPAKHAASVNGDIASYRLSTIVPSRAGYKFIGWRLDNSTAYDIDKPDQSIAIGVSGNATLTYYAQWQKVEESFQVDIAYNANGGSGAPAKHAASVNGDTAIYWLSTTVPDRTGYKFIGWRLDNDTAYDIDKPGQSIAIEVSGNATLTYYAQWQKVEESFQVVIAYNANGGSGAPDRHEVTASGNIAYFTLSSQKPVRDGYTFMGWRLENRNSEQLYNAGESAQLSDVTGSTTATFYAQWQANAPESFQVVIAYDANGGSGAPDRHEVTASGNIAYFTLSSQKPVRDGYTFTGWRLENRSSEPLRSAGESVQLSDVTGSTTATFYAQWQANASYTITYVLNGGTNHRGNPTSYTQLSSVTLYDPSKTGYTFGGWYADSSFRTKVTQIAKGSKGNKTFYAKWTLVTYKITYNLNGGKNSASNPSSYNVTTARIVLKNPSKSGYTFKGWYLESSYKTKVTDIAKGSTRNKTFYAKWEKNSSAASTASAKDTNASLVKSTDAWKKWNQNKAGVKAMQNSGCRVTSFAMMLAEAGYASDFNNPTEFYYKAKELNSFQGEITECGSFGTMVKNYAKAHGGTAKVNSKYKDAVLINDLQENSDLKEKQILDDLKSGKYAILNTSKNGNQHAVYVMREKSLSEGVVWIADPANGANYKFSEMINKRKGKYKGRTIKYRTVIFKNLKKR